MDCYHTQQCRECHRLGVICDSFKPRCKRCSDSGTTCSGYSQSRPMRIHWMEPKTVILSAHTLEHKDNRLAQSKKRSPLKLSSKADREESIVPRLEMFDLIGEDTRALKSSLEFFHENVWPRINSLIGMAGIQRHSRITPEVFQGTLALPDYLRYGMISMALSHQRTRVRNDMTRKAALLSAFLRIRGIMIRSLADDISSRDKCLDTLVFAGIMQLLSTDVSHDLSDSWRYHFGAGYRFIQLRGGMHSMTKAPSTHLLAGTFILTGVFSDSSSPSADQIMAPRDPQELESLTDLLTDERFVFNLYPAYTIAQILRINRLRALATNYKTPQQDLHEQACGILTGLYEFSVEKWVEKKPDITAESKEDHLLLGHTYRSATLLYCFSALESVSVLTSTRSVAAAETQRLSNLVKQAISNRRLKAYVFWAVMILGVAAVHEKLEMRNFVRRWLEEQWVSSGSQSFLHLKNVLERFWLSGKTSWDGCFDKPYIFTFIAGAIVYFALQK